MHLSEQEYIRILMDRLKGTLPQDELDDIITDYSEHFRMGKANGRTDEELWRSLGSPEDVARDIRATHLMKKAEETRSAGNLCHAVIATLGLGLFNLVFVLVPFIILVLLLLIVFIIGIAFAVFEPVAFIFAVLEILGFMSFAIWLSPAAGMLFSIGITACGFLLVIGDYYLARFFYHLGIRYLRWNIGIIAGTERAA